MCFSFVTKLLQCATKYDVSEFSDATATPPWLEQYWAWVMHEALVPLICVWWVIFLCRGWLHCLLVLFFLFCSSLP